MTSEERVSSLLSLFWTPIVAVGATDGTTPNAQISVSTFGASVVPDRPRLLCILYKANHTHDLVARGESFSLSVLTKEQVDLIPALGFVSGRDSDKLSGLEFQLTERGNPVFPGNLGWLECEVIESFDLGDATAFLGAVLENRRSGVGQPITWSLLSSRLPKDWLITWETKLARDIKHYRGLMHWKI